MRPNGVNCVFSRVENIAFYRQGKLGIPGYRGGEVLTFFVLVICVFEKLQESFCRLWSLDWNLK